MFRIMSIATLVMIVVCFFVGAGIALADDDKVPANDNMPADKVTVGNATAGAPAVDVYDFSDYIQEYATQVRPRSNPVDNEAIEESETLRFDAVDC